MKTSLWRWMPALALLSAPMLASAHVGADHTAGLAAGFVHPLSGLDHLIVMIAVGVWAALRGGRATAWMPAGFLTLMVAGAACGAAGLGLPGTEWLVALSVAAIGPLVASRARLHRLAVMSIVSVFAFAHGYAHGAEMPVTASGLAYGAGFMAATALLLSAGLAAGAWLAKDICRTEICR